MNRSLAAVVLSVVVATFASAALAEPTLKVGDPAPPLAADKWLKGGPIAKLEPGTVYVIECWATWCGPCISAIPHVTQLQAQFKDKKVVVIGMNVWERDVAAAEPFVKKMGDKMAYAVATDDTSAGPNDGKMATTWLKAAGRNGIPCSFLVDRAGKIAWIGHPMMMDRPLSMLADDKFDPAEQAKFTEKLDALSADYSAAAKAGELDKAAAALDQMSELNPSAAGQYGPMKVSLLLRKKDYSAATKLATTLAEKLGNGDENKLASLAAALVGAADADKESAALAVKLAARAYEAAGKEAWQYAALLARAYAADKQFDKAAETQAKVVAAAPERAKPQMQAALDEYKQKAGEKK